MTYLFIFIGSGIGGVLRYLLSSFFQNRFGDWSFPIGTLCVNIMGCFVIGFLAELAETKGFFTREQRLLIFVGLLGGFTTFSSFGYETIQLLRDSQYLYAFSNVLGQVGIGLFFVWLGAVIGRLI